MTIPFGTTHVSVPSEYAYDRSPTYVKWGEWFYGPESCLQHYCWYVWHQGSWRRDLAFMPSRHNMNEYSQQFMTISEYKEKMNEKAVNPAVHD